MLSLRRIIVSAAVALCALPAAAQARPGFTPPPHHELRSTSYGHPHSRIRLRQDGAPVRQRVPLRPGFDWESALVGGGSAAVLLGLLGAVSARPLRVQASRPAV